MNPKNTKDIPLLLYVHVLTSTAGVYFQGHEMTAVGILLGISASM